MKNPVLELILEAAPQLQGRGWTVDRQGAIRDAEGFCPICALVDLYGLRDYRAAWKMALVRGLGLTPAEAMTFGSDIAEAADNQYQWMTYHKDVRDLLILALEPRHAAP